VDEFKGANAGLILAEIELKSETELFDVPDWIDKEVTDDKRYYNSNLSTNPYKNWHSK
jgi:adenylate cyclase